VSPSGGNGTLFYYILPLMEQSNLYQAAGGNSMNVGGTVVKEFLCPSDASGATAPWGCGVMNSANVQRDGFASCNYAANVMVFEPRGPKAIEPAMPDGTSNTVCFAERFRNCSPSSGGCTLPAWAWNTIMNGGDAWASPTFGAQNDQIGQMNEGGAMFNSGGVGFQGGPSLQQCNWYVTQGPHTGVMMAGLGDGSVRPVSGSMSVNTWTNACTPNDGNPLGSDW